MNPHAIALIVSLSVAGAVMFGMLALLSPVMHRKKDRIISTLLGGISGALLAVAILLAIYVLEVSTS